MTLLASFVWGAKPDNKVAGASEKDAAVKAEHSSSSLPTRNIFAFVEGVVHKEFYYRTIRAGFQPWERFSFFIERADYQTPLPGDYNRNAVGANWHLPALRERLGVILSGAFNLANGTRQWVPVTDLALLVKFRLFWRLHVFAQTRNYFYRNAVLDESAAGLRIEQLFLRGLNVALAFPMSGYLFRGEPWQIGYGSLKVEYAYYF